MVVSPAGAEESAVQLLGMWKALVEDYGAATAASDGLVERWADAGFGFYNALSFTDADVGRSDLKARLHAAAAFMRRREKAGYLWIFEELLAPEAHAALPAEAGAAGLAATMTCYGMAGDVLPLPDPQHPALRFERVRSAEHLDAYADLNARAYGLSEDDARSALRGSRLWTEDVFAFLGYEGDVPVCCAGSYPVDGRLFVVLVATDPSRQRRGFGEAVTRKALHDAAKATGLRRATLQATAAGRPVYERIGLQTTSIVSLYSLE